MTHVHCPECGFQNPEAANYCSKCGALLIREDGGSHTTMTFEPEEDAEDDGLSLDKRETLELIRAYYRIADPAVRKRLFELTKALGNLPGGAAPPDR